MPSLQTFFLSRLFSLETQMRGSDFIFDWINLLYYKCHERNFKHGGSYIDSPDQTKKKDATINLKNEDDECFQHLATIALNREKIESQNQRVF